MAGWSRRRCGRARRRSRPARGAARRAAEIPGIVGRAVDIVVALPVGEVQRHVGLAEQGDAGIHHALCDQRILCRDRVLEGGIAPGGGEARDVEGFLDGHRHTVQRAPIFATIKRSISGIGTVTCSALVTPDNGIDGAIKLCRPAQKHFQQVARRNLPSLKPGRQHGGTFKPKFSHCFSPLEGGAEILRGGGDQQDYPVVPETSKIP